MVHRNIMMMKCLCLKQVSHSLALYFLYLFCWPFGMEVLGEPVNNNISSATNDDADGRVIYDQRQTGKYNVHVSIKDVAVIEMKQNDLEDTLYDYDDYNYDDSHLTVKPIYINPVTQRHNSTDQITSSTTTKAITLSVTGSTVSTNPVDANNQTYSSNLLADLAATLATNNSKNTTDNSLITTTPTVQNPTQNVIVLNTFSTSTNNNKTNYKFESNDSYARSKNIPIMQKSSNIGNSPIRPYYRLDESDNEDKEKLASLVNSKGDSKIYKFQARRVHSPKPLAEESAESIHYPNPLLRALSGRRCRSNQYRDTSGSCRSRRSSSILKRLLSMLLTLPFANERAMGDYGDE